MRMQVAIAITLLALGACDDEAKNQNDEPKNEETKTETGRDAPKSGVVRTDPAGTRDEGAAGGDEAASGVKALKIDGTTLHAELSPDGSMLAVTGGNELRVFEVDSGKLVRDDFEPMTITNVGDPCPPARLWWTSDGRVWAQCDSGIRGYEPKTGKVHATARWPDLMGITAFDVSVDGRQIAMGQGFAKYFVLHDVAADETTKIDYEIESPTRKVGVHTARWSANGKVVALVYADGAHYFGSDGTELPDAAKALEDTIDAAAVAEHEVFARKLVRPDGTICRIDGSEVACQAREGGEIEVVGKVPPLPSEAPEGAEPALPKRTYALDGSRYADRYYAKGGGTLVLVHELSLS